MMLVKHELSKQNMPYICIKQIVWGVRLMGENDARAFSVNVITVALAGDNPISFTECVGARLPRYCCFPSRIKTCSGCSRLVGKRVTLAFFDPQTLKPIFIPALSPGPLIRSPWANCIDVQGEEPGLSCLVTLSVMRIRRYSETS